MKRSLVILLPLPLLMACKDAPETISPKRENITESVYASGIVKSKNQYQVFATVNGLLQKAYVDEGDTIKKGAPLFTILNETSTLTRENAQLAADLADFQANQGKLDDILLQIDLARNKMQNDSLLWVRQKSLWAQNIGSKVELEKAELNYQNAKTNYASSRIRYNDEKRRLSILSKQAQKNLQISKSSESDFTLKSSMDGKIYSLLKEEGEMVSVQTPLAVIGELDEFLLELQVDEYDITSIRPGQEVKVTMDSYKGEVFDAIITKVHPIMNERSKTVIVEADFIKQPPALYPYLTLEANIILQTKAEALTLPRKFILNDSLVIRDNGDTLKIRTGLKDYLKAEILEGITDADKVQLPK